LDAFSDPQSPFVSKINVSSFVSYLQTHTKNWFLAIEAASVWLANRSRHTFFQVNQVSAGALLFMLMDPLTDLKMGFR
jgi:hypothetical protein